MSLPNKAFDFSVISETIFQKTSIVKLNINKSLQFNQVLDLIKELIKRNLFHLIKLIVVLFKCLQKGQQ